MAHVLVLMTFEIEHTVIQSPLQMSSPAFHLEPILHCSILHLGGADDCHVFLHAWECLADP